MWLGNFDPIFAFLLGLVKGLIGALKGFGKAVVWLYHRNPYAQSYLSVHGRGG